MSSDPTNIKSNIGPFTTDSAALINQRQHDNNTEATLSLFITDSVIAAKQRLNAETIRQVLDAEPIRKMLWDINLLQVSLSRAVEQIAMLELTVQMLAKPTVPSYEWHAHDYQPQLPEFSIATGGAYEWHAHDYRQQPMSVSVNAFEWKSPPNAVNGNS